MIRLVRKLSLLAVASLAIGQSAQAAFINGTDSFGAVGAITTNTGNINTATVFNIGDFIESNNNATGDFATSEGQGDTFGYVSGKGGKMTTTTLTLSSTATTGTATFTFGDAGYGTFTAATYTVQPTGSFTQAYYLLGTFTPGTDFPGNEQGISQSASLVLSFTQNTGSNPSLSGTLSVPPAPLTSVPEPASFGMVALGLGGIFAVRRFRRKSA